MRVFMRQLEFCCTGVEVEAVVGAESGVVEAVDEAAGTEASTFALAEEDMLESGLVGVESLDEDMV